MVHTQALERSSVIPPRGHHHHSGASRVPNIKKHIFKNPVYAVPEWVVVYQSTSIGTLFTPLPVSGVHDIFVFPELEQDQ